MAKAKPVPKWQVISIASIAGKKAELIGVVAAPDAGTAGGKAAEQFDVRGESDVAPVALQPPRPVSLGPLNDYPGHSRRARLGVAGYSGRRSFEVRAHG